MKKDWEIKKLGEVCLKRDSIKWNNEKSNTEYQYIDLSAVDRESKSITETQTITKENAPSRAQQIVKTGDILFGTTRPTLKRFCLLSDVFDGQICSTGFCVVRPNQKSVFPDWIFYQFYNEEFYKYIEPLQKGANYPAVTDKDISNFKIPVPPLEEQKRIVKILDEKIAQLETIKTNVQTNLQNANDLFQSQLAKAFSNTTWEKKRLGDLCSKIGSGATPKGGRDSYKSEGIHLVRSMNVYDSKFVYDELACIDDKQAYELRNVELQENDVLFNITGASVCRCCVLPSEVLPARVNQHVSILRPKQEQLNPTFLCSSMLGYKEILYKMACVGGSTRQAITKSQLEDFEIPLPPLPEQKRIVKELDTLSEKVRQLQEIYTKQIANCADLKQSLLQKAFEGEL